MVNGCFGRINGLVGWLRRVHKFFENKLEIIKEILFKMCEIRCIGNLSKL